MAFAFRSMQTSAARQCKLRNSRNFQHVSCQVQALGVSQKVLPNHHLTVLRASSGMAHPHFGNSMNVEFETPELLGQWLGLRGIPICEYGTGTSKHIRQLWDECRKGETEMKVEGDTVVRHVQVVTVHITDASGMVLHEVGQTFTDGRRRCRRMPLSEKLLPGESCLTTAKRGINEELGTIVLDDSHIRFDQSPAIVTTPRQTSRSYPGLQCQYTLHQLTATIEGLPSGSFTTEEVVGDVGIQHEWEWLPLA